MTEKMVATASSDADSTATPGLNSATVSGVLPAGKAPGKCLLPEGKTLRLLALDILGNREFWVYIYLENRDKISNPNRVPSGIELRLPDKSAYSIDAADPRSVAGAKSLGDEVLEMF